jgi:hypothetical protein
LQCGPNRERDEDGQIPARGRPGLAGKRWESGVGSSRVRFEAVRWSEDAPAMANGGEVAGGPPLLQLLAGDGSVGQESAREASVVG